MQFIRCLLKLRLSAASRQALNYWRLRRPASPLYLHIGCGSKRLDGFINIDLNSTKAADYTGDAINLPCPPNSVLRIEWYHVIEHIPLPLVEPLLRKFYEILVPGGVIVTECPHLDRALHEYLGGNADRLFSIYGRQRFVGDAHYWGYNPESLSSTFRKIGFVNVSSSEPLGRHVSEEPCMRVECSKP